MRVLGRKVGGEVRILCEFRVLIEWRLGLVRRIGFIVHLWIRRANFVPGSNSTTPLWMVPRYVIVWLLLFEAIARGGPYTNRRTSAAAMSRGEISRQARTSG